MQINAKFLMFATALAGAGLGSQAWAGEPGPTLQAVLERGKLICPSHNGSYRGFAEVDNEGRWKGLDIDLCRAMATMILGSPDQAEFVPLSWAQRFPALQAKEIDVIIKLTEWTMSRDTELNLQMSLPYFYGGTQFAIKTEHGVTSAAELDGATICGEAGTSTVRHAANYLTGLGLEYDLVQYEKQEEAQAAFNEDRCDAFIGWGPNLAVFLADAEGGADKNMILPDLVNMGPQAIAMREGDDQFVDVANWMISALLLAEYNGVTSENAQEMRDNPPNPVVAKLLGVDPGIGERLGLPDDWAYKMISQNGNYAEIYDRNLGANSPYKLDRGVNSLWNHGGVLAPMTLD
ncbi:transporter substrate-binding domain-containing protein [Paracoccus seriniphilus]|uniref:transporter substrate-binding domain-containing protein n=1 Tax=Paracoccus seriniphilus TaxID=184748 RepID=UPI0035697B9F